MGEWEEKRKRLLFRNSPLKEKRFLKRSRELLEVLYQKAMKVAALYLQRQEERPQDEPGGGLERLGQLLNTD